MNTASPIATRPFTLIGELLNNSFARARDAFRTRDLTKFQQLASRQTELGADFLTLNIDGTQSMRVMKQEMLDFLPDLVPAIQEATTTPIAFDNPDVDYHIAALRAYKRNADNQPILNSVAASRQQLDRMIALVAEHDTKVIVMASEKFTGDGGGAQCLNANEVYETTRRFAELLRERANRKNDDIIVDPGLAPIAADTYGLVNMSLDAMRLIRRDPDLQGVHISVGLTNFSFGVPKEIRQGLENAYITLALEAGLDFVLGNPEKHLQPLEEDSKYVKTVRAALAAGRPQDGETQEDAGFRQSAKIMDLF